MLKQLLNKETIKVKVAVNDWMEAVSYGGKILEKTGSINHSYTEAMIDTVNKLGPYIVIAPGVAMPHARPEAGVNKLGMSLITLKNPVAFGNDEYDPVSIVICICAVDSESHIDVLSNLMELLEDEEFIKLAKEAHSEKEIIDYIKNI